MDRKRVLDNKLFRQMQGQNLLRLGLALVWLAMFWAMKQPGEMPTIYFLPLLSLVTCFVLDLFGGVICAILTSVIVSMSTVVPQDAQMALLGVLWASMLLIFVLRQNTEPDPIQITIRSTTPDLEKPREANTQDITALQIQLQAALRTATEAQALRVNFEKYLNHDLRTPLNLIIGFSEALITPTSRQREALPAVYRQDLEAIYRNAQLLQNLIDTLITAPRLNAALTAWSPEAIDPGQVIQEAASLTRELLGGGTVQIHIIGTLPMMNLNRTFFRQMLLKLLQYTAQSNPEQHVILQAQTENATLLIKVATSKLTNAQPKNRQFERPLTAQEESALSFCRQFVTLAQGNLWAEGTSPKSRIFCVSLPFSEPFDLNPSKMPTIAVPTASVVVLTENQQVVDLFKQQISQYRVIGISTIEDARQVSDLQQPYAVVITDEAQHAKLADFTHRLGVDVPIISCPIPSVEQLLQKYSRVEHLVKPVTYLALSAALTEQITMPSSILLIDDNHDLVQMFSQMIESILPGTRLWKAYSGREGLALLSEQRVDLVIVDLKLPDIDGLSIIQQIRLDSQFQAIPILLISGSSNRDIAPLPNRVALSIYQSTAIQPEVLVRCVEALIINI
jgi:CheY-like chemotaxis protein/signal transduction histidine kinase